MSAASRQVRAERRAAEREAPSTQGGSAREPERWVRAVALVADGGGYRLALLAVPEHVVEEYAVEVSESEVLAVQVARASESLEQAVRGELDAQGRTERPACRSCGRLALVRHPSKPALLCAACGSREAVA